MPLNHAKQQFLPLACSSQVVKTALKVALVVGSILVLINHGAAVFAGSLSGEQLVKIALTYCVPYCVSTYSSVSALQQK